MTIAEMKHYVNLYSQTEEGAWLNDIEWDRKPVVIVDGPGMGSRWLGDIILIDPVAANMTDNMQFGTYVHELRHVWQRKQQGFLEYALRNLTRKNEPDAEDAGVAGQNWLSDEKCREFKEARKNK